MTVSFDPKQMTDEQLCDEITDCEMHIVELTNQLANANRRLVKLNAEHNRRDELRLPYPQRAVGIFRALENLILQIGATDEAQELDDKGDFEISECLETLEDLLRDKMPNHFTGAQ